MHQFMFLCFQSFTLALFLYFIVRGVIFVATIQVALPDQLAALPAGL